MDQVTIEILDKLNSFYSTGFGNLLLYTGILFALIGVVVPLIIQYIQNRNFRHDALEAKKEAREIVESVAKNLLPELVKSQVTEAIKKANDSIEFAVAGVYFLQGKMQLKDGDHANACISYAWSADHGFAGNDELAPLRAINLIRDDCLPKLNKSHFQSEKEIEVSVRKLIEVMRSKNTNRRFEDTIRKMEGRLEAAKNRDVAHKEPSGQ